MNSSRFLLSLWLALVDMTPPLCVVCAGQQVRYCLVAPDPERMLQNAVGRQLAKFQSCAGCHLGQWPAYAEISSQCVLQTTVLSATVLVRCDLDSLRLCSRTPASYDQAGKRDLWPTCDPPRAYVSTARHASAVKLRIFRLNLAREHLTSKAGASQNDAANNACDMHAMCRCAD